MYKIIIVDDEEEVREAVKQKTDWAGCGYELVGDFGNGRDALEAIATLRPDVVVTDINMPFMDGLLLAGHIADLYRDVKIAIITGYEDFEYARQAIKLKVNDYLLKPVNASEFSHFLGNMKLELDEARNRKEDLTQIRQQLNQSLPLLKERFLERMATRSLKLREIEEKFRYFRLALTGPAYLALVGDLDPITSDEAELLRFAAYNIFQELFETEQGGIVFQTRDNTIGVFLTGEPEHIGVISQKLAEQASHSVEKYLKMKVSIGIGRTCGELSHLYRSYQEAQAALDYRFLLGEGSVIFIGDMEFRSGEELFDYGDWEKKMIAAIRTGDESRVIRLVDKWFEAMKAVHKLSECSVSVYKLLAALMNLMAETGFDDGEVFGDNPFGKIAAMRTLGEVRQWVEEICARAIIYLSRKRTVATHSQMLAAEAYVREHYHDWNLSLGEVCNHVYMSVSYFSAQFKQHTGVTFVEYLTGIRMVKARELLAFTSLKTYEIAARTGYEDPQYFSVIFKRHTGMSPKEFRTSQKEHPTA